MNKPPAFQFYAKDWNSSPSVNTMGLEANGAYVNLLASAWDSDPIATLPEEDDSLRRLAKADPEEWARVRNRVLANFVQDEKFPGRLVNHRLRQQYEELISFSKAQQERASKRWHKSGITPAYAEPMPSECRTDALQLHSAVSKENKNISIVTNVVTRTGDTDDVPGSIPRECRTDAEGMPEADTVSQAKAMAEKLGYPGNYRPLLRLYEKHEPDSLNQAADYVLQSAYWHGSTPDRFAKSIENIVKQAETPNAWKNDAKKAEVCPGCFKPYNSNGVCVSCDQDGLE